MLTCPLLDTEEERRRRKETVVGREVESIRKYANENGMDLPSYLQKWHVLKRNVEEISLLIVSYNARITLYTVIDSHCISCVG